VCFGFTYAHGSNGRPHGFLTATESHLSAASPSSRSSSSAPGGISSWWAIYAPNLYDQDLRDAGVQPPSGVWEWVYNGAGVNDARGVWAHDMGPAENEELLRYYANRHAWLLKADEQPPKLLPNATSEAGAAQAVKEEKSAATRQAVRNQ
jgi:hypothetical protein